MLPNVLRAGTSRATPLNFFLRVDFTGLVSKRMKRDFFLMMTACATILSVSGFAAEDESGFTVISDGKSFDGWKASIDNTNTWKLEDGAFVTRGPVAHLFYVGDPKPFTNFHLKVDVMTEPGSNGGIYFHTRYQERGFPIYGFECQVANTHTDPKRTGSIYDVVNIFKSYAQDHKWWTEEVIVQGNKITVRIDGERVLEYTEPKGAQPGRYTRKIADGTFALQAHDPKSIVRYKNIRVKRLD
jgi:hypothetical protein